MRVVRDDSLLVLDLGLNAVDRVAALDLERESLSGQGLHENLHCRRRRGWRSWRVARVSTTPHL